MVRHLAINGSKKGEEKRDNRDALFCLATTGPSGVPVVFAGVADGISQCPYGGAIARWICRRLNECAQEVTSSTDGASTVPDLMCRLRDEFRADLGQSPDFAVGGCTLTVCVVFERTLHGFWVGDSPILVSDPDGEGYQTTVITVPDLDPHAKLTDFFGVGSALNLKQLRRNLEPDSIVTLATDGFLRVWDLGSLSSVYTRGPFDNSLVEELLEYRFKDDATFVAIKTS